MNANYGTGTVLYQKKLTSPIIFKRRFPKEGAKDKF